MVKGNCYNTAKKIYKHTYYVCVSMWAVSDFIEMEVGRENLIQKNIWMVVIVRITIWLKTAQQSVLCSKRDSVQTFDLAWSGHFFWCGSRGGSLVILILAGAFRFCWYYWYFFCIFGYLVVYVYRCHYFSHLVVAVVWCGVVGGGKLLFSYYMTLTSPIIISYWLPTLRCDMFRSMPMLWPSLK